MVKQNKKSDLIQALETILYQVHYADSLLNDGNDSESDDKTPRILATFELTKSRSLVDTHAKDLPRNFVSWIGGVELGLSNGAVGVDENGFRSTVQDLKSFNDGLQKEGQNLSVRQNYTEILKIIEDVLGSQKYMGDNYVID